MRKKINVEEQLGQIVCHEDAYTSHTSVNLKARLGHSVVTNWKGIARLFGVEESTLRKHWRAQNPVLRRYIRKPHGRVCLDFSGMSDLDWTTLQMELILRARGSDAKSVVARARTATGAARRAKRPIRKASRAKRSTVAAAVD